MHGRGGQDRYIGLVFVQMLEIEIYIVQISSDGCDSNEKYTPTSSHYRDTPSLYSSSTHKLKVRAEYWAGPLGIELFYRLRLSKARAIIKMLVIK